MNLIYIADNYVNPLSGGISRITYVMAEALSRRFGYTCYSVYANPIQQITSVDNVFADIYLWQGKKEFCSWVKRIGGGIIIVQSPCVLAQDIFDCVTLLPMIKVVNVFHGTPGFEIVPLRWNIIRYRLMHRIEVRWTLKQSLLQLAMMLFPKSYFFNKLRYKYARPYKNAHKLVVLSKGVIKDYQTIAQGRLGDFIAIPNTCSFDNIVVHDDKYLKKEVLVVARLDDWHKRISEILRIWEIIQKDNRFNEWVLRIVGDGVDAPYYKNYVNKKQLRNIIFEGQQNSLSYYLDASIFLVTSACEGFPMTVLEAQQCGCIPVIYNSFSSASELVINGENGILVENNDRKMFVRKLQHLMLDEQSRKKMSVQCIESTSRFSVENVANLWNNLLLSL